jgi:hypothetical protein
MKQYQKDKLLKIAVWTAILTITIIIWQQILIRLFLTEM